MHTSGSLVDGGEIGVHVTGVTTTSWDFLSGGRDFSQSVGVLGHIGQNSKHMHLFLVGEELSGGEGESWGDDSLNSGVVGQVDEQDDLVHGSIDLEICLEETSGLHIDTHSGEDDDEVLL